MQTIENPMALPQTKWSYTEPVRKPECDCGSIAKIKVNGQLRCWDCASDEFGVERL